MKFEVIAKFLDCVDCRVIVAVDLRRSARATCRLLAIALQGIMYPIINDPQERLLPGFSSGGIDHKQL
jgi:hypothetical protein